MNTLFSLLGKENEVVFERETLFGQGLPSVLMGINFAMSVIWV